MLGKLKKTLSEKCPECHKNLQLRVLPRQMIIDGEEIDAESEYKYCPNCETEMDVSDKKHNRHKKWK